MRSAPTPGLLRATEPSQPAVPNAHTPPAVVRIQYPLPARLPARSAAGFFSPVDDRDPNAVAPPKARTVPDWSIVQNDWLGPGAMAMAALLPRWAGEPNFWALPRVVRFPPDDSTRTPSRVP